LMTEYRTAFLESGSRWILHLLFSGPLKCRPGEVLQQK
jgi:hypothetical protein